MRYQASRYKSIHEFNEMKRFMQQPGMRVHTVQWIPGSGEPLLVLWEQELTNNAVYNDEISRTD